MNKKRWAHTEWANRYDTLAQKEPNEVCASGRHSLVGRRVIRQIESDATHKLRLSSTDTLLDLGCGTGLISVNLSKKVSDMVGLDFGREVLLRAKDNFVVGNDNIAFIQADITALPFRNEVFSKVLCYSVVHYLNDYEEFREALLEMARVCRPGGLVLVGDIPEKNKKELWVKGGRRKGELMVPYLTRKLRGKIVQQKYRVSVLLDERRRSKLNISSPQAAGISYDTENILRICAEIGVKGCILDQPGSLPLGHTHVDLVLEKEPTT